MYYFYIIMSAILMLLDIICPKLVDGFGTKGEIGIKMMEGGKLQKDLI